MKKVAESTIEKGYKKTDIFLLVFFIALASAVTVVFKTNLMVSILLFFGLPCLYLSLRNPGIVLKGFIFSLLASVVLSMFVDVLATLDETWVVPNTIFPFKILGVAVVENFFFCLFWILFLVLFYEHFFDKGRKGDKIDKRIRYAIYIFGSLVLIVVVFYFINIELLRVPYFYLLSNLMLMLTPLVVFLCYYPKFLKRFVLITIFFFVLTLTFELSALEVGQWFFPGKHFIGFVEIFKYRFPLEEFLFYMIIANPAFLVYYEFFADNRKL